MKVGINMFLWTGHVTIEDHGSALKRIAETGFDGAEVPVFDVSNPAHYRSLGEHLDGLGLKRTAAMAFTDPAHNPVSDQVADREAAFDHARRVIDCAAELGGERVVGPMFQQLGAFTGRGPTEVEQERCADFLRALALHAHARGIVCAVEHLNRFEAYVLNTAEQAVAMMQAVGDPSIGILYDTFHAHIEEKDPIAALDHVIGAGALSHVHISENNRGTPGSGHAKIAETIALLKARNYDGWLTIEAFGKAVPELAAATKVWRDFFADPMEVVTDGHAYIRQCLSSED
jgi:D-psicose/D-tagatose/L-ribulose 3-epimerase